MPVTIQIPAALKRYAGGRDSIDLVGDTTGTVLVNLVGEFPDLANLIFDETGGLRSFLNFYVNNEDIRYLEQEATRVKDGDVVMIVAAVAGG